MIVQKDATPPENVELCHCEDAWEWHSEECEWEGEFISVTLVVNGFPHRRILRRSMQPLAEQVRRWLRDPVLSWDDACGRRLATSSEPVGPEPAEAVPA